MHATLPLASPEPRVQEGASQPHHTPTVPLEEERAVVARLRNGDRAAFAILYRWYGDPVYRAILARLPQREAAEDCLREAFRRALERLDQFSDHSRSIFFWIRRIGINLAMDAHRGRSRDQRLTDRLREQVDHAPQAGPAHRPDRGLEVADTAREVALSLSRMSERYATALRLRLLEDRPREECAAELGVSIGAFDVLLHRATKQFRKVYPP